MREPIQIRMGGYGPPSTTFSRAMREVGDRLAARFGDRIDIKYVWNVMDLGYRTEDMWDLVQQGVLTLAYQSTSGLSDRVPALGIADLPFLFADETAARAAIDGSLGAYLAATMEAAMNYRIFGFFENGFRHVSNCHRAVRMPADLAGMKVRTLQSQIHARAFELLGATPTPVSLSDLPGALQRRDVDAQENPLANTVTYGAHKFHRYHTLTNHFYVSRAVFAHRPSVDAWPDDLRQAVHQAVREVSLLQRTWAEDEEKHAGRAIEEAGGELIALGDEGRRAFQNAVRPIYREAHAQFGDAVFHVLGRDLLPAAAG